MKFRKHFFFIAVLFALLSITSYFKYNMENGWDWLIPFGSAIIAIIFIAAWIRTDANSTGKSLISIITCPFCGHEEKEIMPENACEYFYECKNCKVRLKPKEGDCCIYCSYGSEKCPSVQAGKSCC